MSASGASGEHSADRNVEMWKIKRLIKRLEMSRGNRTSMISLILRPREQIAPMAQKLADEYADASNIKSRVNRLSVLGAITSVQARLKLYQRGTGEELPNASLTRYFPPNGLVI